MSGAAHLHQSAGHHQPPTLSDETKRAFLSFMYLAWLALVLGQLLLGWKVGLVKEAKILSGCVVDSMFMGPKDLKTDW